MRPSRIVAVAGLLSLLFSGIAAAQINPIPLIIQDESGGNPTAQNARTTASGLFQDTNSTWAEALAACNCGTTAQYPTAASAPSSVQIAANDALINQNGLSDWLCAGCDSAFAAQVAADGGVGSFQTSGLDTNPADFASTDTAGGLSAYLASLGAGTTETGVDETGQPTGAIAGTGAAAAAAPAVGNGALTGGLPQPPSLSAQGDAAAPNSGFLDQIVRDFGSATGGWQSALATIATRLFWILAAIELFVMLYGLALQGERPSWFDVVATLISWLFPICLFWWLLQNGSTYTADIINSMRQAGTAVGGDAITPSGILGAGVNLVSFVWNQSHPFYHPSVLVAEVIALVVIMICFALMAVWMAATLIEAYFIIGASALFLAFGGLRWTRQIAVSVLLFSLGVGAKLFAMEAIVAVTAQYIIQWIHAGAEIGFEALFRLIGFSIFLAALAKTVPDTMQRVILSMPMSLAHYSQPIQQAQSTAATIGAGVAGVAGSGTLAWQLIKHAAEADAAGNNQGQSTPAHALQFAGNMGGAAARAAGSEIGARLGGFARGGPGASVVRMAQNVAQQRRIAAAQRSQSNTTTSGGAP
jgi:type IV secretion system protein TrbL